MLELNLTLATKRLLLRPCSLEDVTVLHVLWIRDRIRRFLFDDRIISEPEASTFIESSQGHQIQALEVEVLYAVATLPPASTVRV
jgi:RimJ/RimL family protein N-acetyltransferase